MLKVLRTLNTKQNLTKRKQNKRQHSQHQALVLTYCCISDECLSVGHHRIHSHLLVVLTRDDGDTGLLGRLDSAADNGLCYVKR